MKPVPAQPQRRPGNSAAGTSPSSVMSATARLVGTHYSKVPRRRRMDRILRDDLFVPKQLRWALDLESLRLLPAATVHRRPRLSAGVRRRCHAVRHSPGIPRRRLRGWRQLAAVLHRLTEALTELGEAPQGAGGCGDEAKDPISSPLTAMSNVPCSPMHALGHSRRSCANIGLVCRPSPSQARCCSGAAIARSSSGPLHSDPTSALWGNSVSRVESTSS